MRALGTPADADPMETIAALHLVGPAAVPHLIRELAVVDPPTIDDRARGT